MHEEVNARSLVLDSIDVSMNSKHSVPQVYWLRFPNPESVRSQLTDNLLSQLDNLRLLRETEGQSLPL